MDERKSESREAPSALVEVNTSTYLPSKVVNTSTPLCQPDSTSREHEELLDQSNVYNIIAVDKEFLKLVDNSVQNDMKNSNVSSSSKFSPYYDFTRRSKSVDISSLNMDEKEKKSSSREMKALINSAKESKIINEFTQVSSKIRRSRKDAESPDRRYYRRSPGDIPKTRRYSLQSNSSESNRRSMRSSNPDFVSKQKKFLNSVSGKEHKRPADDNSDSDSVRSASVSNTPINYSKRRKINKNKIMGRSEMHPIEMKTIVNGRPCDPFCWRCHSDIHYENSRSKILSTKTARCSVCPRSYHLRCIKGITFSIDADMQEWVCPECASILHDENIDNRSPAMRSVSLSSLCNLLEFALDKMTNVTGVQPFLKPVDYNLQPDYKKYIAYPIDLSTLSTYIAAKKYGSTTAFYAETKWILHNSIIYNSQSSKLTNIAKAILKTCKAEMNEIESCPSCYEGAYTYRNNFFTDVCENPHILLWAKLKGYPYWPAKGMCVTDNMSVDVRFFGAHDRAWVPSKDCYLYSAKDPNPNIRQRKHDVREAVKEMEEHIENIRKKFGHFQYAPVKTRFLPLKLKEQFLTMIPNLKDLDLSSHCEKITKEVITKRKESHDSDNHSNVEGYGTEEEDDASETLNMQARMKFVKEVINDDGGVIVEIMSSDSSTETTPVKNCSEKRRHSSEDSSCKKILLDFDNTKNISSAVENSKTMSSIDLIDKESVAEPTINKSMAELPKHKCKAEQMKDKSSAEQLKYKSTTEKPKDKLKENAPNAIKRLEHLISNNNVTSESNILTKNIIIRHSPNSLSILNENFATNLNSFQSATSSSHMDNDIPNVNVFKRTKASQLLPSNLLVRLDQLNCENLLPLPNSELNNTIIMGNPAKEENDPEIVEPLKDTNELSNDEFSITNVMSLSNTVDENYTNDNNKTIESRSLSSADMDPDPNASNAASDNIPTFLLPIVSSADNNVSGSSKQLNSNVISKENEKRPENVVTEKLVTEAEKQNLNSTDINKNDSNVTDNIEKAVSYTIKVKPDSKLLMTPPTVIRQAEKVLPSCQNREEVLTEPMAIEKKNLLQNLELLPSHEANKSLSAIRSNEKQMRVHRSLTNKIRMLDADNRQDSNMGKIIEPVTLNNVSNNNLNRVTADISMNSSPKQIHKAKKTFPPAIQQQQAILLKQYIGTAGDAKKVVIRATGGSSGTSNMVYFPIEHDKNTLSGGKDINNRSSSVTPRSSDSHLNTSSLLMQFQVTSLPGSVGNQPIMQVSPACALSSKNVPMKNIPPILTPPPVMAKNNNVNCPQIAQNQPLHPIDIAEFSQNVSPAGTTSNFIREMANKMSEKFKGVVLETLLELSQNGNPEAKLRQIELELEKKKQELEYIKHNNQEELKEMKHNYELMVTEIKASFETELKRQISKVKYDCAVEKNKAVAETKAMQWCTYCFSEASLHCCWNTAYCSKQCQYRHWDVHEELCSRESNKDSPKSIQAPILMPNRADISAISLKSSTGYGSNNVATTALIPANLLPTMKNRKFIIKGSPGNQVAIPITSEDMRPSMSTDQTLPRNTSNYIMMKTSAPSSSKQDMHINTTNPQ